MSEGCFGKLHAFGYGLFVEGDEVVMAFGQGFAERFHYGFGINYGAQSQQRAEQNHVVCFGVLHLDGSIHCVYGHHGDIGAGGQMVYTRGVVDQSAAGLNFAFKLIEALLVEDNGSVECVEYGR